MSDISKIASPSTAELLKQKDALSQPTSGGEEFAKHLKSAINEVNDMQKTSEQAIADLATGQVKDLHQAALAINKAETSMKLMLEIRNKALNAYKEVSRTQL
ncbi:flagellar hook-basal body complex protein FliE [Sulfurimonas paralvinellae]|uniref:Flagellar hook-basal body complex protein FliE n=1 Tax=Sulfurimonas paralvinellae TaxID=317658 RepID=A0A7M1B5V2_9BACT|nr:flagellar hook-basal body complex protein FliE [Sulfurimonas paralvinellae]QOP45015.1 flagellar hook-basal body complex protein FliE [Sulfurimonas paralvinellae]